MQTATFANVALPAIISDNMAVQAGRALPIWGTADAGEKVRVTLGGQTETATADADGKWLVKFKPLPGGDVGTMTVAGSNTLTVKNIVAGSVWVCSGQAGMLIGLDHAHNAATEVPKANDPKLRLFKMVSNAAIEPQNDCAGQWVQCTPKTAANFAATAYFFGRDVRQAAGVPVGLIQAGVPGAPAQAWISLDGLDSDPALKLAYGDAFRKFVAVLSPLIEKYEKVTLPKYEVELKAWEAADKQAKAAGGQSPRRPQKPVPPDQGITTPSVFYNGMIAPLIPYAIDGVIWYQGTSNVANPAEYRVLLPRLITDWRAKWGQGDFAFIYGQLPNLDARRAAPSSSNMAMLREAQTMALKQPRTAMAVTIDIGEANSTGFLDLMDVGHRLAVCAQKLVFGKDIVCSGPLYSSMKVEGSGIRVSFNEIGGGLVIGSAPPNQPGAAPAAPLAELKGFAIAGADQKWVWASAKIDGSNIVVSSPQVASPVAVRYAWADNPECNLYGKEGFPASPFRTDQWPK